MPMCVAGKEIALFLVGLVGCRPDMVDFLHEVLDVGTLPVFGMQTLTVEEQNVDVHPHDVDGAKGSGVATTNLYALQGAFDLRFAMFRVGNSQAVEESVGLYTDRIRPNAFGKLYVAKQLLEQLLGNDHIRFLTVV